MFNEDRQTDRRCSEQSLFEILRRRVKTTRYAVTNAINYSPIAISGTCDKRALYLQDGVNRVGVEVGGWDLTDYLAETRRVCVCVCVCLCRKAGLTATGPRFRTHIKPGVCH